MILLLSCYANAGRWARIREGWLEACGIPFVIAVGDPTMEPGTSRFTEGTRLLTIGCDDGYDDLTAKVAGAVRAIRQRFDPEFLFKIDDDVIADPQKVASHTCIPANVQYCGKVVNHTSATVCGITKFRRPANRTVSRVDANYCAGPIYLLRRRAIQVLADHMDPSTSKYEDVAVGLTLAAHGIEPTDAKMYSDDRAESSGCVAWHDATHASAQNAKDNGRVAHVSVFDPRASALRADGGGVYDVLALDACTVAAGGRVSVATGWTVRAPDGARVGAQPVLMLARAGVDLCAADLTDRGLVILHNHGAQPFAIEAGATVARFAFEAACAQEPALAVRIIG